MNLWVRGHGFLQVSSQTLYKRWEPMHFPQMGGILPLTSRIEYEDSLGYFTNLYEFDARLALDSTESGGTWCASRESCETNDSFRAG